MSDSTDIDYGPLAGLIGTWTGDKGTDMAPEKAGLDENPYYETIVFEGAEGVENAEEQVLTAVRYHLVVRRTSNGEVFHDQVGYWTWDSATGVITQSLTIPRAVCLLAGGEATGAADGTVCLKVHAKLGDPDWGIVQSPFMRDKARTLEFSHELTVEGDRLSYFETTVVEIYGRTFDHTDRNELTRQ